MPPINRVQKQKPGGPAKTTGSVVDRISSIGFDDDEGIKIALYGRSGTGKTTLWSSFPKPILAIICSGHQRAGELRSIDTPENRKTIKTVTLKESREAFDLIDHQKDTGKFKTIVLDHGTGLQDLTLKEILGLDELPAQKSWGMAKREQYGQSTAQCKEILRKMLGLTCNVVVVAQERSFTEDSEDEMIDPCIGPALSPSLTGWLNPAVDYVAQTFIRQKTVTKTSKIGTKEVQTTVKAPGVDYCLRVGPHAIYTTKFRMPKGIEMPEVIVDPDFNQIMGLVKRSR